MLNVGFDSQIFRLQKRGGISKYFTKLINEFLLKPELGVVPKLLFTTSRNMHLEELRLNFKTNSHNEINSKSKSIIRPANHSLSLVHHTYYLPGSWLWNWNGVHISTIHDMIPEKIGKSMSVINPHLMKKYYVEKSNGNIAISETTKVDALNFYGTSVDKIERIYHGVDNAFFGFDKNKKSKFEISPYFMFVGNRGGYKNFLLALKAMSLLPKNFNLVAIGGGKFSKSEQKYISSLNLERQIVQFTATEDELAELYFKSIALIAPSRFEGFGMSSLEAMASGCPVISSTTEALVEIGGNAVLLFDPDDYEHLSELMIEVFINKEVRQTLKHNGRERASNFSWFECARNTANFYSTFFT